MPLPTHPRRILFICMRRIGDVLLSTALIRSMRRAWPDARVEALVNAGPAVALEGNPDIDRLWIEPEPAGWRDELRLIKALFRRFDLAVTAQYNDRPHLWALIASANRAGVVPPEGHAGARLKRRLLSAWCEFDLGRIHALEQYLRVADALGIERSSQVVPPRPAVEPKVLGELGTPYAVLHPSPMYRFKGWTTDGWTKLAAHLAERGLIVCLTGGKAEADRATNRAIADGLGSRQRERLHDLAGRLRFAELTPLIERAEVYVGPDTSVTHLAAATGTPTVALFGPSPPVAWAPWPTRMPAGGSWQSKAPLQRRGNVWLVQGEGDCVPCGGEGCDRHIESRSRCLDELAAARVIEVVELALRERVRLQAS